MTHDITNLLDDDQNPLGVVGSPSSSFEANIDISQVSETSKLLGELACFKVLENENTVLVLGQITKIETKNRWHEEPSFKGIIKRHGRLPNLSGVADNRIAKINVQSSFVLGDGTPTPHKLANSPSTGTPAKRISNPIMAKLMAGKEQEGLVSIGKAYDTDVHVPFWFKHFGSPDDGGAGEAYHIGVFGKTGSGKTTVSANMLRGYARHSKHMSILIIDPQGQFYEDNNVVPGRKFQDEMQDMRVRKYKLPMQVILPPNAKLFSELLLNYDFIKKTFRIHTEDKQMEMRDAIEGYIGSRFEYGDKKILADTEKLYHDMLNYFLNEKKEEGREPLGKVYSTKKRVDELKDDIRDSLKNNTEIAQWSKICRLFCEEEGKGKVSLSSIINNIVNKPGNVIILNISGKGASQGMDGLETFYIKLIEDEIRRMGERLYAEGKTSNCLIVMDEAHRYISTSDYHSGTRELTTSIIDSVRTTRKYGIGYMFITQTIDSLHPNIREQIRIFSFGYGLTSGTEFRQIKDIINDNSSADFYRSFIDPSSNRKYPFMFFGPISPLSFTGMPLFLEMSGDIANFPVQEGKSS